MRTLLCIALSLGLLTVCVSSSPSQSTNSSSYPGKGYILGPEEGEKVLSHLMKVDPEMGSQRMALGKQRLRTGHGIPLHIHDAEDKFST